MTVPIVPPISFGSRCSRRFVSTVSALLILSLSPTFAGPFQKDAADLDAKIRKQVERFTTFQSDPSNRIPPQVLANARGIILIHKVKAGLGIGGEAGGGLALVRDPETGAWSAPGFVASAEGSWGLQFGAQETDLFFVLMDDRGLKILQNGSLNVGVDVRATAGPNAAGGDFDTTTIKEPVLVYSSSAGVFAGAAFKGGGILPAKKNNATYYGMTLDEILFQRRARPTRPGMEMIAVLNVASGMTAEEAAAAASGKPLPPREGAPVPPAPAGSPGTAPPAPGATPATPAGNELKPFTPPSPTPAVE